jgi:hypothetical protein
MGDGREAGRLSDSAGTLDEAYERLHSTGPEFDGYLSNHGPMAAEAMVRRGHSDLVGSWLDGYMRRLEEFPRGLSPIGSDWQEALGDPRRVADWTAFFRAEIGERPWRELLNAWWPRLLPGVVAAATHGVIRVGHAVRALQADGDDPSHLAELAHGLAYWAARWQTLPGGHAGASAAAAASRARAATPLDSLAAIPRIAEQTGGIGDRLARLGALAAVYAPAEPAPRAQLPEPARGQSSEETAREVFARAVEHGDPHVIKFADTAVDVFARTGNTDAIAAVLRATELIEP